MCDPGPLIPGVDEDVCSGVAALKVLNWLCSACALTGMVQPSSATGVKVEKMRVIAIGSGLISVSLRFVDAFMSVKRL